MSSDVTQGNISLCTRVENWESVSGWQCLAMQGLGPLVLLVLLIVLLSTQSAFVFTEEPGDTGLVSP